MDSLLYVRKRSSGGRGEYELAGEYQGLRARDFLGCHFSIKLGDILVPSHVELSMQGGKPRLRLDNGNDRKRQTHLAGLLSIFLLMPRPCRSESAASHALPILQDSGYLLDFSCKASFGLSAGSAILEPIEITVRSGGLRELGKSTTFSVSDRLADLRVLHENYPVKIGDETLEMMLGEYFEAFYGPNLGSYETLLKVWSTLTSRLIDCDSSYLPGCDPLPFLLNRCGCRVLSPKEIPSPEHMSGIWDAQTDQTCNQAILRRQRSERWYRAREGRGAAGKQFRKEVVAAYHNRCAICGAELPGTAYTAAGIQAAHILPWAEYELDTVQNGLALCPTHHWAFDNHVIALERATGQRFGLFLLRGANYDHFCQALKNRPGVIEEPFVRHQGDFALDRSFFPDDAKLLPSAQYLERFNNIYLTHASWA